MAKDDGVITFPLTLENMQAFMSAKMVVDRRCPFCGAKPGKACTTLRGRKVKGFHKQRSVAK